MKFSLVIFFPPALLVSSWAFAIFILARLQFLTPALAGCSWGLAAWVWGEATALGGRPWTAMTSAKAGKATSTLVRG